MSSPEPHASIATTLLQQVRAGDPAAWQHLTHVFGPVVSRWCWRSGLQRADVEDVTQEVFRRVAGAVADFHRGPSERFTAWLAVITRHCIADHFSALGRQPPAIGGTSFVERQHEVPAPSDTDSHSGPSPRLTVLRRVLDLVREDFEERTWQAFWRVVVEGQATAEVAAALGLSTGAVRHARFRVLRRLREEMGRLEC